MRITALLGSSDPLHEAMSGGGRADFVWSERAFQLFPAMGRRATRLLLPKKSFLGKQAEIANSFLYAET